jgi:hypothetical protein
VGKYQVLKYREEGSELRRESRSRTVYELLFGRLCADANGIGEEIPLVPASLGDGLRIEEKGVKLVWTYELSRIFLTKQFI